MERIKKNLRTVLLALCGVMLFLLPAQSVRAALLPTASDNMTVSLRRKSDLVNVDNGYMRVFYNGTSIGIEYYDNNFKILSKKSVAMELPVWGGFYAGSDGYYVVEGKNNLEEDDKAEIIRVIKYDKGWRRKGAASITGNTDLFGGEVRFPFNYGCVEFAEQGDNLYIVTGHEGYVDPNFGQGHQGFLMIAVDKASMTGKIVDSDLWHSFAQYIKSSDSYLYVLEQSEGSRYTKLSRYDTDTMEKTSIPVFKYGGSKDSAWAIACYASVDGMVLSKNNVLCLGTSIDQSKYDTASSSGAAHNIYLTVTPMSDFSEGATEVKWLTDYVGNHKSFLGAKITKINDYRFMISWEEYDTEGTGEPNDDLSSSVLHYLYIDEKGNKISKEYTAAAPISDCQPIVKDSKVIYYASNANTVNFYSINSSNGAMSKNTYRALGENATWNFSNGVLTVSGTGKISLAEKIHRNPISSTAGTIVYSTDGKWAKAILNNTKKIIIKSGITEIGKESFADFPNLKEVILEPGVKCIREKAFYSCENLRKITIPSSVTKIEKDILWTGSYWVGDSSHVVYASIYAEPGSYAVQYAKQNDIQYIIDFSKASVSGLKSSYQYTGKALTPAVTVKMGKQVLRKEKDYQVVYRNNKNTGTATVTITGLGNYEGTIKKTFKIVKASSAKKNIKKCSVGRIADQRYTGKSLRPTVIVKDGSKRLKNGTDYTLTYKNNKMVGKASVVITGKGRYSGSVSKSFSIKYMTPGKGKVVRVSEGYYKITRSGDSKIAEVQYVKPVNKKKTVISIPSTIRTGNVTCKVTSIAANAFKNNRSIKTLSVDRYVVSIGNNAFLNCTRLSKIKFGAGLEKIGVKAFANCKSLRSLVLPGRVSVIGKQAFYGCNRLKTIVIRSSRLTSRTVGGSAFGRIHGRAVIKVPTKKLEAYTNTLKTKGLGSRVRIVKG